MTWTSIDVTDTSRPVEQPDRLDLGHPLAERVPGATRVTRDSAIRHIIGLAP